MFDIRFRMTLAKQFDMVHSRVESVGVILPANK